MDERILLSKKSASLVLSLSVPTIERMVRADELPGVVRLGKRVLFNREILQAWARQEAEYQDEARRSRISDIARMNRMKERRASK